eukprot:901401-Rhodomonas_salina.5
MMIDDAMRFLRVDVELWAVGYVAGIPAWVPGGGCEVFVRRSAGSWGRGPMDSDGTVDPYNVDPCSYSLNSPPVCSMHSGRILESSASYISPSATLALSRALSRALSA